MTSAEHKPSLNVDYEQFNPEEYNYPVAKVEVIEDEFLKEVDASNTVIQQVVTVNSPIECMQQFSPHYFKKRYYIFIKSLEPDIKEQ